MSLQEKFILETLFFLNWVIRDADHLSEFFSFTPIELEKKIPFSEENKSKTRCRLPNENERFILVVTIPEDLS